MIQVAWYWFRSPWRRECGHPQCGWCSLYEGGTRNRLTIALRSR